MIDNAESNRRNPWIGATAEELDVLHATCGTGASITYLIRAGVDERVATIPALHAAVRSGELSRITVRGCARFDRAQLRKLADRLRMEDR